MAQIQILLQGIFDFLTKKYYIELFNIMLKQFALNLEDLCRAYFNGLAHSFVMESKLG